MRDAERLAHHQTYSEPLLKTLKMWMQKQVQEREVAPNSSLGKAFTYMLSRWPTLTQFLSVPGAPSPHTPLPIDSNPPTNLV